MSDLKKQLIKLGSTNPELRPHIRPLLASLPKKAKISPTMLKILQDAARMAQGKLRPISALMGEKELKSLVETFMEDVSAWLTEYQVPHKSYKDVGRPISLSKDVNSVAILRKSKYKKFDIETIRKEFLEWAKVFIDNATKTYLHMVGSVGRSVKMDKEYLNAIMEEIWKAGNRSSSFFHGFDFEPEIGSYGNEAFLKVSNGKKNVYMKIELEDELKVLTDHDESMAYPVYVTPVQVIAEHALDLLEDAFGR